MYIVIILIATLDDVRDIFNNADDNTVMYHDITVQLLLSMKC